MSDRRKNRRIVICAIVIIACWLLPLTYRWGYYSPGSGYIPVEASHGYDYKTGFVKMSDGGRMFVPGLLVPSFGVLCVVAAFSGVAWFTITTALGAGLLAIVYGLVPFLLYSHQGVGAYLSVVAGLVMLMLVFGFVRGMRTKVPQDSIRVEKESGTPEIK